MIVVQDDGAGRLLPIGSCRLEAPRGSWVSVSFVGQSGLVRRVRLKVTTFVLDDGGEDQRVVLPKGWHPGMLPGWLAAEGDGA
jgi:hypothetical protein